MSSDFCDRYNAWVIETEKSCTKKYLHPSAHNLFGKSVWSLAFNLTGDYFSTEITEKFYKKIAQVVNEEIVTQDPKYTKPFIQED
jgi:hypothetical protein